MRAKAATGGKPMGRAPAEEPDVFLDIPNLHVGKLEINVERLAAQLALRAQVGNLVAIGAGVHASVDKVLINLEDVDASAQLTVRLQNTYNILDRTLTTIDENPEILQGVIDTAGLAVEQVGAIGTEAAKPGGALSELTSGVGDTLTSVGGAVGGTLTSVTDNLKPRRLLSAAGRGVPKPGSKAAARIAAGGVAGLVLSALFRAQRRPRVLGIPVGRRRGIEQLTKQIGLGQ